MRRRFTVADQCAVAPILSEINRRLAGCMCPTKSALTVRLMRYCDAVREGIQVRYSDVGVYDFLLCLCRPDVGCVSSIAGRLGRLSKKNPNHSSTRNLTISSRTAEEHRGKRYNLFLRALTLLLAPSVRVDEVVSIAVNPVSTYVMYRYFRAASKDLDRFLVDCASPGSGLTFRPENAVAFHRWITDRNRDAAEQSVDIELDELATEARAHKVSFQDWLSKFGWASREEARAFLVEQDRGGSTTLVVRVELIGVSATTVIDRFLVT